MNTHEKILAMLESEKDRYLSGEEIAASLKVSRAAVWKAVNRLRNEGYIIEAVTNRGYRLAEDHDLLTAQGIWKYLDPDLKNLDIQVLPEAGSTNALVREKADAGYPEGLVLLAGMQTDGRGRLGRRFYSPANTGIYMSLLLRPEQMPPVRAVRLTTMAAAAVCEAVEAVSGKDARIKWVNDIYIDGRKVCGILTEGSISVESGCMGPVVLGIGINVYAPEDGFPKEIRDIAGAVFEKQQPDGKDRLAAEVLNRFMRLYRTGDGADYVRSYRERCFVIGRDVRILEAGKERKARVLDVDDECRLVVRLDDGSIELLSAGEIAVREG